MGRTLHRSESEFWTTFVNRGYLTGLVLGPTTPLTGPVKSAVLAGDFEPWASNIVVANR